MKKEKAIPEGYMTVGQLAKKMDITVRTLQYYDKEKLLCPSAESEGGRRLYTDKDLIMLYQILSLKSLGFSLDEIKTCLNSLNTPAEFADLLTEQAEDIRRKTEVLSAALENIKKLRAEVLQMQEVNYKKYADIIVNLQMNNNFYFMIKGFDDKLLDHMRSRFNNDSGPAFLEKFNHIYEEMLTLQRDNPPPESERCQQLAKEFWEMIMEFTKGDLSILSQLMETGSNLNDRQARVFASLVPALEIYLEEMGLEPFGKDSK